MAPFSPGLYLRFFGFQMLSAEDKLDGSSCFNGVGTNSMSHFGCLLDSKRKEHALHLVHIARCALYLRFGQVVAIAGTSDLARKTSNEKDPVIVLLVVVFYSAVH
ncbi:hypothetical protein PIB30_050071 [Stylosanthes scabra]|uniref:Uncharacterized protein n=1 Tax=Stylosanthes scabra TaxID=79078 RepID=A0ABU6UGW2_9FABA|nr:hypothetical protein [Stylosanthes scabra]